MVIVSLNCIKGQYEISIKAYNQKLVHAKVLTMKTLTKHIEVPGISATPIC